MTPLNLLKSDEERLYAEYLKGGETIAKADFADQAGNIVDRMTELSRQVTSSEEFEFLRAALEKWRTILVTVLKVPKAISITMPPGLEMPTEPQAMMWSDPDIENWIRNRAHELAKERAVRKSYSLTPSEMLARIPSTPEEAKADFELASVYFAAEVIDGLTGIGQLRPGSYARLESVWLEDIKRLKAYYNWIKRNGGLDPKGAEKDYDDACTGLQNRLLRQDKKWETAEFDPIHSYLERICLTNGNYDSSKAANLVAVKAYRLWTTAGKGAEADWAAAEKYVKAVYPNMVEAATRHDTTAASTVTEMLDASRDSERLYLITNAFEFAVAAHFVAFEPLKAEARSA